MDAAIVYYSRTGNTRRVADRLATRLDDPMVHRVTPTRERSYPNWLLRSFVPGSRVPIEPVSLDPAGIDAVLLGAPKWTVSCPPLNEVLATLDLADAVVAPFITFGGFDEDRYLRRLAERLRADGASVPATLRVQRDAVDAPRTGRAIHDFLAAVGDAVP